MKSKLCDDLIAGTLALPVLASYGKEDTQIMFSFGSGANNARLFAEVLAQATALGSSADLRISGLPKKIELQMAEVVEEFVLPAVFSTATAASGEVPDATLAEVLTAAVAVERLAGHVPLRRADQESKLPRTFMDAGSRGKSDPPPEVIQAAVASGKPAHIFAFEAGFGFEQETLAWAEGTRKAQELLAKDLPLDGLDPKFSRVQVHLFHSSQPEHRDCAACSNLEGKNQTLCTAHPLNITQLVGRAIPAAKS